MTRKLTRRASLSRGIAPLIVALTVLISLAVLAQSMGTGPLPAKTGSSPALQVSRAKTPLFLPAVSFDSNGRFAESVAVADVNGDGKPDTVVVNGTSKTVGVLLGNGNGIFQPAVTYGSGGMSPTSVAIADVNSDGKPDLVVANSDSNMGVLLGNGDGTFQPAVVYFSGAGGPQSVVLADVNGDGKLDMLVAHQGGFTPACNLNFTELSCIGVLLGNGDGTFQSALTYSSGGGDAKSVAVADVNSDGKADLVVTNRCLNNQCARGGSVGVLLGNGDGTFKSPVTYDSRGFNASSVAVADVNGDGKLDLLVTDICADAKCQGRVAMFLGNGDGTFQPAVTFSALGYFANWIVAADLNGDGNPDLAVALSCTVSDAKNCGVGAVAVLLGYGNGIFQPAVLYPSGGFASFSVAVHDVNGDGKPDLVATNETAENSDGSVGILLNVEPGISIKTTTAFLSSPNPSSFQQAVTLTATVTSASGPPPGTVVFYDSYKRLGKADLVNGSASISISSLSPGAHVLRAATAGLGAFGFSASANVTQIVAATTTTLSSSPNPSNARQTVTFTAQVTGTGANPPTGKIKFLDGTKGLGSVTLSGGVANLAKSTLAVGLHPITAIYLGDHANARSTSPVVNQVVQ